MIEIFHFLCQIKNNLYKKSFWKIHNYLQLYNLLYIGVTGFNLVFFLQGLKIENGLEWMIYISANILH